MKNLIALLAVATGCLAAEVAYSPTGSKAQGALLVLPLKQENSTTSTTPRSAANGTENLEDVNAKLSERLKQEQGSQQGQYHVYLQDGRLQKVQYVTAPIVSPQPAQQSAFKNYNQQETAGVTKGTYKQQPQAPEILRPEFAERRGVYFVQVPQERIQALQGYSQQQQTSQPSAPAQYSQEESFVRYLPLQPAPSSQYREEQPLEAVVRYLPVPLGGEAPRQESAAVQEAVVQYSEVQPISGPVYSYSPAGLTRILRYAPVY